MPRSPFDSLVRDGVLTRDALAAAAKSAASRLMSVGQCLIREHGVPPEKIGAALSEFYKVPYVPFHPDLHGYAKAEGTVRDFLCTVHAAPIGRENGRLVVLMADPKDLPARDQIRAMFKEPFDVKVALQEDIALVLLGKESEPRPPADLPPVDLSGLEEESAPVIDAGEADNGLVELANHLLVKAWTGKMDEIRIDPRTDSPFAIRSGERWESLQFPPAMAQPVVRRLKVMANLDIGNRNKAQQGLFVLMLPGGRATFGLAVEPLGGGDEAARVLPRRNP